MPTYEAIQREVRTRFHFVPKTCWIAYVLALSGRKLRAAPNRIDRDVRKYPCPAKKRGAIIEAFHKLDQHELRLHRSSL